MTARSSDLSKGRIGPLHAAFEPCMKRSALLLTAVLAAPATASAKPLNLKISQVANATVRGVPAGAAMADAGDVNGDGLADLIVGGGPAGRRSSSNSAFVVFG